MLYLSGGITTMLPPDIGLMLTPNKGNVPWTDRMWAADNGCFTQPETYSDDRYLRWLAWRGDHAVRCLFATAPDVVGDAAATIERSLPMLSRIRNEGYPAALVAQDGLVEADVPWAETDVLFLGGTTEWKLGHAAAVLAEAAQRRGVPVHMGRVNSLRRLRIAQRMGCASVDGCMVAYRPTSAVRQLRQWMEAVNGQAVLPLACEVKP